MRWRLTCGERADIRYIQAILGHNDLDTTRPIYTQGVDPQVKPCMRNTIRQTLH